MVISTKTTVYFNLSSQEEGKKTSYLRKVTGRGAFVKANFLELSFHSIIAHKGHVTYWLWGKMLIPKDLSDNQKKASVNV